MDKCLILVFLLFNLKLVKTEDKNQSPETISTNNNLQELSLFLKFHHILLVTLRYL